jgi:hypothetical protein
MTVISTKEAAEMLGTDPKTLRRFIRAQVRSVGGTVGQDTPGRGKRYGLDSETVAAWAPLFAAWERGGTVVAFTLDIAPEADSDA